MLEISDLLVKCPQCGAWPMAARPRKATFVRHEIIFKCAKCGSEHVGRVRYSATS